MSHRLNISPLPKFPIFVKFCQRRPVCYLRHDLRHNLPYCQICNSVKFCYVADFEFIGNFWWSWFLVQLRYKSKKKIGLGLPGFIQFLSWDPILFTLFLFNANSTLNLTNHKQNLLFVKFSHGNFPPIFARFSPIRAFNVFFYVNFYIFF